MTEQSAVKPRPRVFRALGRAEPPERVQIDGDTYQRQDIFKHDSWAATAVYQGPNGRIVCKFNRQQSVFGIPMRWLGRWLARREMHLFRELAELSGVPVGRGPVCVDGRPLATAAAHDFVAGHPLGRWEYVGDEFFPALQRMLAVMHAKGIAYVDLHKSENILVGEDGLPHLIDFQVCYIRPRNRLLTWLTRGIERRLQEMDLYHVQKHLCCKRPDVAGYDWKEFQRRNQRPWWIHIHRVIAVPLRTIRRRLLVALGIRQGQGYVHTEHFAEAAVRSAEASTYKSQASQKAA